MKTTACRILILIHVLAAVVCFPVFSVADDGGINDSDYLTSRMNSFKEFEAEEIINYSQLQLFLKEAQIKLTKSQQRFQVLAAGERSSLASPVQRKILKVRLSNLEDETSSIVDELQDGRDDCLARIEILKSFTQSSASLSKDIPEEVRSLFFKSLKEIKALRRDSEKQLARLDYLLKVGGRFKGRIVKLEQSDSSNLFQLWSSWVLESKEPMFTSRYWSKIYPGKTWLRLKSSEYRLAWQRFMKEMGSFLFYVLLISATGAVVIRWMDRSDYFQNRSEIERKKSLKQQAAIWVSFAVYVSAKKIFPESMGSLSVIAFGVFFWAVLKLSKLISRGKSRFVSGETRTAFLFVASALLLVQQIPARLVTLVFTSILLCFWGYALFRKSRNKIRKTPVKIRVNRFIAPLFLLAFLGYGRLACVFVILISLIIFIYEFGSAWAHILFIRTEMSVQLNKGLVRSLAVPVGWAISFGIVAFWAMDFFGESAVLSALDLSYTWMNYSVSVGGVLALIVFFIMTKQCVSAFRVAIEYVGSKWSKAKKGAVPSIQTLFSYAVWSFFVLVSLKIIGLSLTSITVIAGGLSVGIGFGLQNIVNNFIGGLILLFGRSIQQGDVIEVGSLWCTVKKINIRTTQVETFDNAVILIPNSDLVATQVTNWTKNDVLIRRDINIGVAYGSDIEKVSLLLQELAESHEHVLKDPKPYVHFNDFGSSSLDFILRIWIDDIDVTLSTMSEIRFAIDRTFRESGIEIAFPQMDLHLRSVPERG